MDVIVSEWMGYALFFEAMLDSVLHARDRRGPPKRPGHLLISRHIAEDAGVGWQLCIWAADCGTLASLQSPPLNPRPFKLSPLGAYLHYANFIMLYGQAPTSMVLSPHV